MIKAIKRKRLIKAVQNNKLSVVESLVSDIEDVSVKDKKGRSLLAIAYNYNSKDVIDFLRSKGLREEINELYMYAVRCFNNADYEEAILRFSELTGLLYSNAKTYFYLGNSIFNLAQQQKDEGAEIQGKLLDDAIYNIEKALQLDEEDHRLDTLKSGMAYYILAYCYSEKEDQEKARNYIQSSIEFNQDNEAAKELLKKLA